MKFKEFANSFWLLFIILVSVNLSGCANLVTGALAMRKADSEQAKKDASQKPQLTQLQTRQLQTRNYQTEDTKIILQTALAVLQDDGFVVQNANVDLGLLAASKSLQDINVDSSGKAFLKGFFGFGGSVSTKEFSTVETTVTVTLFGKETRVRLSARLSSVEFGSAAGSNTKYEAITEAEFYQAFFSKLEKGIFIEQQNL